MSPYKKADLVFAINVLAHVPNVLDFLKGVSSILKINGTAIIEFQYLVDLIRKKQFDTMYHEHFSYFSVFSLVKLLTNTDLVIYNIEKLKTHGGSLRVLLKKKNRDFKNFPIVQKYLRKEIELGVNNIKFYRNFQNQVEDIITKLNKFIKKAKSKNLL